jgi:cell division protein FtsI (penicillin-binding protein 3)/stage V sporulation protein D (sporulation-specific penicillin-binding protein)
MRWNAQARTVIVCFALVGVFSIFSVRLIDLQVARHAEYAALAAQKHVNKQTIYARRGIIRDASHEVLAENLPVKTVVADASHIREPMAVAEAIANQLEMDPRELADRLKTGKPYIVLKREVPEGTAETIQETLRVANLRGIFFEQDFVRVYPNGSMLAQVLGFVDHQHKGAMGIERTMQEFLQGTDGYRYIERDRTGRELVPYRGLETAAKDGYNVTLTIDLGLQSILESEIETAWQQYKPKMATAVMMNPHSGEILAMVNRPTFDPNRPGEARPEETKNRPIVDMVEPGSTFKIVATAAALEEKLVTPETRIFCENGRYKYVGRILRDSHPHGVLSVHQILVKSSNIGVAKLALQLGDTKLYGYVRKFGFGEKSGVALTGEIPGLVNPPHRWSKLDITRIPMGQAVAVTPLQMAAAMAVIANGGNLMKPLVVSEISDSTGRPMAQFKPEIVRQVISKETVGMVTAALKDVVSKDGTAQRAAVKGFAVAGKTGTAQKVDPNGGYQSGKYVVSFVGFMPADEPRFVLLVMFDDASTKPGENYGGLVAAPIFSKIAEKAARYLDLRPTEPMMPESTPANPKKVAFAPETRD